MQNDNPDQTLPIKNKKYKNVKDKLTIGQKIVYYWILFLTYLYRTVYVYFFPFIPVILYHMHYESLFSKDDIWNNLFNTQVFRNNCNESPDNHKEYFNGFTY